jgi:hypothetical protein
LDASEVPLDDLRLDLGAAACGGTSGTDRDEVVLVAAATERIDYHEGGGWSFAPAAAANFPEQCERRSQMLRKITLKEPRRKHVTPNVRRATQECPAVHLILPKDLLLVRLPKA